ncbi:hypothetical protein [Bradyrhizobium genomosp. III]|uniref:hypothetical protein n=1 Tax=Bradyrhizobium genomosp. III TaxID=2683271 RepID=UPI0004ADF46E|nr:hypothetical protein [Bradyrhizobium sp. CCBAU 15544]
MLYPDPRMGYASRKPQSTAKPAPAVRKFGRGIAYSDAAYSDYIAKVRADDTAKSLAEAEKLCWPGLPSFHSVLRRRGEDLRAALKERGITGGVRLSRRVYTDETYARAVDLISKMSFAQYAKVRECEDLPSQQAIHKRAERDAAFATKLYASRPKVERPTYRYSEEAYEAAIAKIGESGWDAYVEQCEPGKSPSLNAIYKRARKQPEFKARLRGKTRDRFRLKRELRALTRARGKADPVERPDGQLGFLLLQHDAYRVADGFVPRHFDRADRDDIKSDIVAAVLSGEFSVDEIGENAGWFISEHSRNGIFTSGKIGSLDEPFFEDGSGALIDRLSIDTASHY